MYMHPCHMLYSNLICLVSSKLHGRFYYTKPLCLFSITLSSIHSHHTPITPPSHPHHTPITPPSIPSTHMLEDLGLFPSGIIYLSSTFKYSTTRVVYWQQWPILCLHSLSPSFFGPCCLGYHPLESLAVILLTTHFTPYIRVRIYYPMHAIFVQSYVSHSYSIILNFVIYFSSFAYKWLFCTSCNSSIITQSCCCVQSVV